MLTLVVLGIANAEDNVTIGKSNIKLKSRMMTPEALWAMGRIGGVEASPNGQKIVYQVGYYSVKANKSRQVICVMNADGSDQRQLSVSSGSAAGKSETDPTWLDNETIAFITGGEIWSMKADGSERKQLSKTDGKVEGFKFSPDHQKVIIIKSIPHEARGENYLLPQNDEDHRSYIMTVMKCGTIQICRVNRFCYLIIETVPIFCCLYCGIDTVTYVIM